MARITERDFHTTPSESVTSLMASVSFSSVASSVMIWVPKRSAWARICSMRSGPMMPSANPG